MIGLKLPLLGVFIIGIAVVASETDDKSTRRTCGTSNPTAAEQARTNKLVQIWKNENANNNVPTQTRTTIDTHFHVITDGDTGYLTPDQIANSLDVLNSALSPHGFHFVQASETSYDDNPSWFHAARLSFEEIDMKSFLRVGGAASLNVYFSNADGHLGYATLPDKYPCAPEEDGVVVRYTTVPGGVAPYNEGDTLTHEVGHWLGLYHTFEGGCSPGDGIDDTNPQAEPTYGCPQSKSSCGSPDPINNFMDYSDDVCMTEFSNGQADRMRALWDLRANPEECSNTIEVEVCFSPYTTVLVEGKGGNRPVSMKDIVPGDRVLTASGRYETVYTFSHYHHSKPTIFLQIHTVGNNDMPLEVTGKHLVFVHGKSYPIPAMDLEVGDIFQKISGKGAHPSEEEAKKEQIKNITTVTRNGFYNPITADGTIVVDSGIIASTYTLFPKDIALTSTTHVVIAGAELVSIQRFVHLSFTPYRQFCMMNTLTLSLCNQHGEGEVPWIIQYVQHFYIFWSHQAIFLQIFLLAMYISIFGLVSCLTLSPSVVTALTATLLGWCFLTKHAHINHKHNNDKSKAKLLRN